jgi:hypothetical protein
VKEEEGEGRGKRMERMEGRMDGRVIERWRGRKAEVADEQHKGGSRT